MKKIMLLIILLLLLTGCEEGTQDNEYTEINALSDNFYIYVDEDTCVEYFVSYGHGNTGNVNPRYTIEGQLKTNEKCLNEKGE